MHTRIIIGVIAASSILLGCSSITPSSSSIADNLTIEPETRYEVVAFATTQCNDTPWELAGYREDSTEQAVKEYLLERHAITVEDVTVVTANEDVRFCSACGCPTGETIEITVTETDVPAMNDLGFVDASTALDTTFIEPADAVTPLTEEVLQEIKDATAEELGDTADTSASSETEEDDTTPEFTEEEQAIIDSVVETEVAALEEVNAADALIESTATAIQEQLTSFFQTNTSYPNTLQELTGLDETAITDFTYTPIGSTPATYYDLSVPYSTGREILNP